jgi:hypothetical protein
MITAHNKCRTVIIICKGNPTKTENKTTPHNLAACFNLCYFYLPEKMNAEEKSRWGERKMGER